MFVCMALCTLYTSIGGLWIGPLVVTVFELVIFRNHVFYSKCNNIVHCHCLLVRLHGIVFTTVIFHWNHSTSRLIEGCRCAFYIELYNHLILLWLSFLVRTHVWVFWHSPYRIRIVLAMFFCFSDTCFCLPSTWSLQLSNPVLPLWAWSEYSRPHNPLHFQSQCVGAHIRSLPSAKAYPNMIEDYCWFVGIFCFGFQKHCIGSVRRYKAVWIVCFIEDCVFWRQMKQRMVESGITSDCWAQGGSIHSWVVSSFLSSPWQHLHTSTALVAICCGENIQTARWWQPYLYSHTYLTFQLAFRSPKYKFVIQTKVHQSLTGALLEWNILERPVLKQHITLIKVTLINTCLNWLPLTTWLVSILICSIQPDV